MNIPIIVRAQKLDNWSHLFNIYVYYFNWWSHINVLRPQTRVHYFTLIICDIVPIFYKSLIGTICTYVLWDDIRTRMLLKRTHQQKTAEITAFNFKIRYVDGQVFLTIWPLIAVACFWSTCLRFTFLTDSLSLHSKFIYKVRYVWAEGVRCQYRADDYSRGFLYCNRHMLSIAA